MAEEILAWFYGSVAASILIMSQLYYSPDKPALHGTIFVENTMKYPSKINKEKRR